MKRISTLLPRLSLASALAAGSIVGLSGCALMMERSGESGYQGADATEPNLGRDRRASERETSMNELGLARTRELSDRESEAVELRSSLRRAERDLVGRREREQYYKNKPYMKSDRERIEFLQLGSYEARQRWLNAKGIQGTSTPHPSEIQSLIEVNDITLGMTRAAVRDSWGEPELVEVAGNPLYGNERWHYSEQTSSTEGYRSQHRMVYFEAGRVSGWESR